jgi:NOL1/NOP2/sun family putative RNA methylase
VNLPIKFTEQMKILLGDEFEAYMESFQESCFSGLRVNTLKIAPEEFEKISPFLLKKIAWTPNGYYIESMIQPAKHPYYYAGLYYIQEPSAMAPANILPITPGDKVLDLCAAPGGKTTELAAKLKGEGVLISNDISSSRAQGLRKNIELFGISNALVLSESHEKLVGVFEGYFDKILVDAPCSGEGMFRKDTSMIKNWEEKGSDYYASIQKDIILAAAKMLNAGGMMLYSTCTFSPKENEGIIAFLLEEYPEFRVLPIEGYEAFDHGRPEWVNGSKELSNAIRIWPHKVKGEGHFAALLIKNGNDKGNYKPYRPVATKLLDETNEFLRNIALSFDEKQIEKHDNKIYLLPKELPNMKGLRILRSGLLLGEEKKKRFEPSQALASSMKMGQYANEIHLHIEDPVVIKYLKGETIEIENKEAKGWQLILVDKFPLGWGKANNGILKNKYCPGWRWM